MSPSPASMAASSSSSSHRRRNSITTLASTTAIATPSPSPSPINLFCCEDESACLLDSDSDDLGAECLAEGGDQSSSSPWKLRSAPQAAAAAAQKRNAADEDEPLQREEDEADIDGAVSALIDREVFHVPAPDYSKQFRSRVLDASLRQNAIAWLFKVAELYSFNSLTSSLSVNYFDRFLSRHSQISRGKSWMIQLLSVACLSLAAKMEETEVPLVLDLQVGQKDCFIFEPRTIQRMELLVLSTLEWRVSSVTPFSYIDYFFRKLNLHTSSHRGLLLSRMTRFLLCTAKELRFLEYRPSSVAIAALLCAIQCTVPLRCTESMAALMSMLPQGLQGPSEDCYKAMVELFLMPDKAAESCPNSVPQSPIGVLDASFSSTSDSESTWRSMGNEVPNKKRRLDDLCRV